MAFPWLLLAAVVVGFVGLMLLMPKPKVENARPEGLDKLNFPTASEGSPAPLILGTIRHRGPNTIGGPLDFKATAIKKKVKTGLFSSKKVTTGYKYSVGLDLGLGLGPGVTLGRIWIDKDEVWAGSAGPDEEALTINKPSLFGGEEKGGGFVGTLRFYGGNLSQPVNAYMASHVTNGLPAYVGQVHIVLEGCYIGTQPQLRAMSFELSRLTNGIGLDGGKHAIGQDMNPAEMLYQIMTLEWGGLDVDPNDIDLPSFVAAGETLYDEGNGMSLLISSPNAGKDAIEEVLRQIDGNMYQDPVSGKILLSLVRKDYDVETLPVLDQSSIQSVRSFSRTSWDDTVNQVRVTFTNRANKYEKGTAFDQDLANIGMQGRIRNTNLSFPGVTNAELAQRIAAREKGQLSVPLFRATIEVNRTASGLRPGQPFIWSWPEYRLAQVVMRVQRFSLGDLVDGRIVIDCVQDQYAIDSTIFAPPEPSGHVPIESAALAIEDAAVLEAPYWLMQQQEDIVPLPPAAGKTYVMTMARSPDEDSQQGYTSTIEQGTEAIVAADHASYSDTAVLNDPVALSDGFVAGFIPVLDITAASEDGAWLSAATTGEAAAGANLFLLGSELMSFETLVDNGDGTFTLGTVRRALLDTTYEAHVAGDVLYFLSVDGLSEAEFAGTTALDAKMQSFTYRDETPYDDADVFPLVPNRRYERPLPPDNLRVNATRADMPVITAGTALSVAWNARNRLDTAIKHETEAASGEEGGVTYILRWYLDGLLKGTVNPATTPTVINPSGTDAGTIRIEVTAVRDGLESYTPAVYLIESEAAAGPDFGSHAYWRFYVEEMNTDGYVGWIAIRMYDADDNLIVTTGQTYTEGGAGSQGAHGASAPFDGNAGTYWLRSGAPSWVQIQFTGPVAPVRFEFDCEQVARSAIRFKVQSSDDGVGYNDELDVWEPSHDVYGSTRSWPQDFSGGKYKALRFYITGATAGGFAVMNEAEFHATIGGGDFATGGATKESVANINATADRLFDNNNATRMEFSNAQLPAWARYAFATPVAPPSEYLLYQNFGTTYGWTAWKLQGTVDGLAWDDLDTQAGIVWSTTPETKTFEP